MWSWTDAKIAAWSSTTARRAVLIAAMQRIGTTRQDHEQLQEQHALIARRREQGTGAAIGADQQREAHRGQREARRAAPEAEGCPDQRG